MWKKSQTMSVSDLLCSNYKRPNVALCLTGSPRTFVNPITHRTIQENLIKAFGGDFKVFMRLHSQDQSAFQPSSESIDDKDLKVAIDSLSPAKVSFVEQNNLLKCNPNAEFKECNSYEMALVGQLRSMQACMEDIEAYEKQENTKFDFVMKTRPDAQWYLPVRPHCMWNFEDVHGYRWIDWANFVKREDAHAALTRPYEMYQAAQSKNTTSAFVEHYIDELQTEAGAKLKETKDLLPLNLVRSLDRTFTHDACLMSPLNEQPIIHPHIQTLCADLSWNNPYNFAMGTLNSLNVTKTTMDAMRNSARKRSIETIVSPNRPDLKEWIMLVDVSGDIEDDDIEDHPCFSTLTCGDQRLPSELEADEREDDE